MLELKISDDGSKAFVSVLSDEENVTLSADHVTNWLKSKKVIYGIIEDQVHHLVQNPLNYAGVPLEIARGKPAENGKDGYIEYAFEQNDRSPEKGDEKGKVDFREIKNVDNIKKGELLARRISPTKGENGFRVTGEPIKARPGKEKPWKLGKNVVLDKEKDAVFAAIDGQVSLTDGEKLNVFPVYEVNGDVDFGIGNIDFVGTVVVRGNILAGFKVRAEGDLRVYGGIEGAEVDVNGSVEVTAGIAAQNKGYIRAGLDVKSSYIQNANVITGRDIIVSQSIMHSHVKAGRNVECEGSKGLIVGGVVQAGEKVKAVTIGNMMNTATSIEVGAKPELREEMDSISSELKQAEEQLSKTDQALKLFDKMLATNGSLPPDKKKMQIQLTNAKMTLEKKVLELTARKDEIVLELENITYSRVEALSNIYPGTKLVFGNQIRFIKENYQRIYFVLEKGEIVAHPMR
ncbi:MAG: DUF342 domain-containing protein [Bacillaceae bacterium]|nr:DUF342 domain-containing protein [Bacillaceae bacterium]